MAGSSLMNHLWHRAARGRHSAGNQEASCSWDQKRDYRPRLKYCKDGHFYVGRREMQKIYQLNSYLCHFNQFNCKLR